MASNMKRIRIVPDKPNYLFETWLEEWMNKAVHQNSNLHAHFSKALKSLKKYPLPLESGRECIILQHFGTKLCTMIDRRLEEHKRKTENDRTIDACISQACNNEQYTIVSRKQSVKDQTCEEEQREITVERGIKRIKKTVSKATINTNSIVSEDDGGQISFEPNTFDIILLLDTQETCGGKTKPQGDAMLVELTEYDILFEVRRLKIGDFAWIAKCKRTNNELVIPYIIERKRMDDLCASIKDGRFHEQKFRLKQSGIENLMYIVESTTKNTRFSIPYQSLLQASVNCLIQDGFTVKYTRSHKDSISYLSCVTQTLINIYKDKRLVGCKKEHLVQTNNLDNTIHLMQFKEFNNISSKQKRFKVSEMFIRQLLQLKGMSVTKAMAIVERYATPQILIAALQNSDKNGEQLLANIQVGDKKRQLGPTISRTIYQLYMTNELN